MKAVVRSPTRQCKDHAKHVSVFHIEPLSSGFPSQDPSSIPLMLQLPPGIPTQAKHTNTHILSPSAAVVCSLQQTAPLQWNRNHHAPHSIKKKKKKQHVKSCKCQVSSFVGLITVTQVLLGHLSAHTTVHHNSLSCGDKRKELAAAAAAA